MQDTNMTFASNWLDEIKQSRASASPSQNVGIVYSRQYVLFLFQSSDKCSRGPSRARARAGARKAPHPYRCLRHGWHWEVHFHSKALREASANRSWLEFR